MTETETGAGGDELIDSRTAADILGVDLSTLSRWSDRRLPAGWRPLTPVHRGRGPSGAKLFKRADVEALRDQLARELPAEEEKPLRRGLMLPKAPGEGSGP
jgi:hypothetical protein